MGVWGIVWGLYSDGDTPTHCIPPPPQALAARPDVPQLDRDAMASGGTLVRTVPLSLLAAVLLTRAVDLAVTAAAAGGRGTVEAVSSSGTGGGGGGGDGSWAREWGGAELLPWLPLVGLLLLPLASLLLSRRVHDTLMEDSSPPLRLPPPRRQLQGGAGGVGRVGSRISPRGEALRRTLSPRGAGGAPGEVGSGGGGGGASSPPRGTAEGMRGDTSSGGDPRGAAGGVDAVGGMMGALWGSGPSVGAWHGAQVLWRGEIPDRVAAGGGAREAGGGGAERPPDRGIAQGAAASPPAARDGGGAAAEAGAAQAQRQGRLNLLQLLTPDLARQQRQAQRAAAAVLAAAEQSAGRGGGFGASPPLRRQPGVGSGGSAGGSDSSLPPVHWPPPLEIPHWMDEESDVPDSFRCPITLSAFGVGVEEGGGVVWGGEESDAPYCFRCPITLSAWAGWWYNNVGSQGGLRAPLV